MSDLIDPPIVLENTPEAKNDSIRRWCYRLEAQGLKILSGNVESIRGNYGIRIEIPPGFWTNGQEFPAEVIVHGESLTRLELLLAQKFFELWDWQTTKRGSLLSRQRDLTLELGAIQKELAQFNSTDPTSAAAAAEAHKNG